MDNQVYTIGVAPDRDENSCYISFGNSIVASLWGNVVERLDEKESYIITKIDMDYVARIKQELPLLKHIKKDIYCLKLI